MPSPKYASDQQFHQNMPLVD